MATVLRKSIALDIFVYILIIILIAKIILVIFPINCQNEQQLFIRHALY